MGQPLGGGVDAAGTLVLGTFTGTGQSTPTLLFGSFNVSLWGTFSATVQLERSFDGGTTWLPVSADTAGDVLKWTAPMSLSWPEIEHQVYYRLNCTAFTSGTVNYRISQGIELAFYGKTGS